MYVVKKIFYDEMMLRLLHIFAVFGSVTSTMGQGFCMKQRSSSLVTVNNAKPRLIFMFCQWKETFNLVSSEFLHFTVLPDSACESCVLKVGGHALLARNGACIVVSTFFSCHQSTHNGCEYITASDSFVFSIESNRPGERLKIRYQYLNCENPNRTTLSPQISLNNMPSPSPVSGLLPSLNTTNTGTNGTANSGRIHVSDTVGARYWNFNDSITEESGTVTNVKVTTPNKWMIAVGVGCGLALLATVATICFIRMNRGRLKRTATLNMENRHAVHFHQEPGNPNPDVLACGAYPPMLRGPETQQDQENPYEIPIAWNSKPSNRTACNGHADIHSPRSLAADEEMTTANLYESINTMPSNNRSHSASVSLPYVKMDLTNRKSTNAASTASHAKRNGDLHTDYEVMTPSPSVSPRNEIDCVTSQRKYGDSRSSEAFRFDSGTSHESHYSYSNDVRPVPSGVIMNEQTSHTCIDGYCTHENINCARSKSAFNKKILHNNSGYENV